MEPKYKPPCKRQPRWTPNTIGTEKANTIASWRTRVKKRTAKDNAIASNILRLPKHSEKNKGAFSPQINRKEYLTRWTVITSHRKPNANLNGKIELSVTRDKTSSLLSRRLAAYHWTVTDNFRTHEKHMEPQKSKFPFSKTSKCASMPTHLYSEN